jgi:HlyD family secretion protein
MQAAETEQATRERLRAAEADARQARALLAGQERSSATTVLVRAPARGRVLRVAERSERIVAAGTPLLEVGDPSSLEIVVDVLSSDGAGIHPGNPVRLAEWAGGNETSRTGRLGDMCATSSQPPTQRSRRSASRNNAST